MVWILIPKAEYLPQGNQNIIMNILVPPRGIPPPSATKWKLIYMTSSRLT